MRLFAITGPGLLATAAAVLALWTCLAGVHTLERRAERDLLASRRAIERLRERATPVSRPATPFSADRPSVS